MPINRWLDKQNVLYPYSGILKRKEILTPATMWIKLENMKYASHKKDISKAAQQSYWHCLCEVPGGQRLFSPTGRDAEGTVAFSEGYYPVCHQLYKGC